jgi:hypothetical protein
MYILPENPYYVCACLCARALVCQHSSLDGTIVHTIGLVLFAECPKHSAKLILHSAKAWPSAALGKLHTTIIVTAKKALPSAFSRAPSKTFAVYQTALGKVRGGARDFAECYTKALGKVMNDKLKKKHPPPPPSHHQERRGRRQEREGRPRRPLVEALSGPPRWSSATSHGSAAGAPPPPPSPPRCR